MDLLEGALYGMDLLKLHSVTTKLLARVENIEKVNVLQSSPLWDLLPEISNTLF